MPKEKRTFHSEVLAPASLRLQESVSEQQKQPGLAVQQPEHRQYFAPELINRLAEKIKKL